MNRSATRDAILSALRNGPMTEAEIIDAVCPHVRHATFPTEVAQKSEVRQAIGELKLEHRIWPENGKYRITSKGQKDHGKVR